MDFTQGIQESYGVNPFIFAALYFGTVPIFWASLYYLVKNYRNKKPLLLPLTGLLTTQLACYIYLFSVGRDMPLWVYGLVAVLIVAGLVRTWKTTQRKALIVVNEENLENRVKS